MIALTTDPTMKEKPAPDDLIAMSYMGDMIIGQVVTTNYDTGPYRITKIVGPCRCPEYVKALNGDRSPSDPHFHLTCVWAGGPNDHRADKGNYWLNGYRIDGTSAWNDDRLTFHGVEDGAQLQLFA